MTHLLVFLSAAAYECLFLCWGHAASKGQAVRAAGWSMLLGTVSLYGLNSVVKDGLLGPALIAGYGFGTWLTLVWISK